MVRSPDNCFQDSVMAQDETKVLLRYNNEDGQKRSPGYAAVTKDQTDNSVLRVRGVQYRKLPFGIWILEKTGLLKFKPLLR